LSNYGIGKIGKELLIGDGAALEYDNFRGMKEAVWGNRWKDGRTCYQAAIIYHDNWVT
jgi:hypothetical protein